MTESASLLALFAGSFFAATLLPGGSEAELYALLKAYPDAQWPALLIATCGNTLGAMVTFGMGWLLPQQHNPNLATHVARVQKYGYPMLLLAWAPLIGDALCLAAGWLRLSPWLAVIFIAIGKFARYWVIAMFSM